MAQKLYVPEVETHLIESRQIGQTFQIQVAQPLMAKNGNERFPVLYITDGNALFDMARSIASTLHVRGEVKPFIVVGIGYPGTNPLAGSLLRCREFTSELFTGFPDVPLDVLVDDVPVFSEGQKRWGGADDFLDFLRNDLIPMVDGKYPVIPGDRTYCGHSLGGGFGFHALFSQPDLFNRHLLISPAIVYGDDDYGLREARQFIESGRRVDTRLFMAVGGEEEFQAKCAAFQFTSSFHRMAALLHETPPAGLELTRRVYPGETHESVLPFAFSHGIQALFGASDEPPKLFERQSAK